MADVFKARPTGGLTVPGLLGDERLLLILFIALRLTLLLAYQPVLLTGGERGLAAGGDFQTYFQIAALSDRLGAPFRDWWSEFPPVWSFLTVLIYQAQGTNANYGAFALLLALFMLAVDAGNLLLLRRLGAHLHGLNTGLALAWIYAVLAAPLILAYWTFEPLVTLWLLLGLWWLLNGRESRSAAAAALGALTKFTPALLLGAAWRFRSPRQAAGYTVIVIGLFGLAYLPLFAQNAAMTLPSLTAQFNKASYQTVWALLDGNYRTGSFGPLSDRADPAKANVTLGRPAVIPGWARLGAALAIGLWIFARVRRYDDRGLAAFVTLTLLIFFLQAQGWSPQWLSQIIPLVLLCFPTRDGVLVAAVLGLVVFVEYPFLFIRTGDTGGAITGALITPFALLVLARTAILVGLCVGLYRKLREPLLT